MRDEYKPGVPGGSARGADFVPVAPVDLGEGVEAGHDERCGLTEQSQKRIGTHLRAMYEGLIKQPVPDRFRDLIEKLQSADTSKD